MAKITYIFIILLFMNIALVQSLNDCTKYGCKTNNAPIIITNATINQTFYIVNNSFFNSSYAPYTYVNEVVLGNASGGSMDYPYVNDNILGNKTDLYINLTNYVIANYIGGNNITVNALVGQNTSLWNEALNKYNASYAIWAYNQTIPALTALQNLYIGNNSLWLSTHNVTYDAFTSINNQSIWAGINAMTGGNASWNETRGFEIFVPYTGAIGNVDLGNWNFTTQGLIVNNFIRSNSSAITTYADGVFALAKVDINNYNATGYINVTEVGSFIYGYLNISVENSTGTINAKGKGSVALGAVYAASSTTGTNNVYLLESSGTGSFAQGSVRNSATNPRNNSFRLMAIDIGSFAQGNVQGCSTSSVNCISLLESSGIGSFAQGYVAGGSIISSGNGAFAQGSTALNNSLIKSSQAGSFAQGYVSGINSSIQAISAGAFARGYMSGANQFIIASGNNALAWGGANLSATNTLSMAWGQNVNVTGANSYAIGLGSPLMQHINNARVFAVMTGAVGINVTNPQKTFHVNGTSQFENTIFTNNITVGLVSGQVDATTYINSTGCKIETLAGVVREWTCP